MLTKIPFYHGITRKLVIAMGGLFGNIYTVNKDQANSTKKIVKVPISFLSKEKFILRLQQDPALAQDVEISLPRLSFEIVGYDYDAERQLNKMNRVLGTQGSTATKMYAPVPYNVQFNVYSFTRTMEDNLQIMEQILPYFTPDMNLSIKMMQNPEVIQNVPVILNSVQTDDQYDGGFEDRRYIITTYSFILKTNYYGAILGGTDPENHFESGDPVSVIKKVEIEVNNGVKYTARVDPFDAGKDDDHQVIEGWTGL